ncbi:MAG: zinc-ribbon domain-containing protein, partial [Hydrogenophaga sp.]|uniref:zinc-ribbon domain-containing protein n=1 Tax=Hydrogenophaga sp. TaxID=1904254 RepID=UPI00257CE036
MSFTTRCPACGTVFRVVADQLKISDGWVRCGHCSDVFDATIHLQPWTPPARPVAEPVAAPAPPAVPQPDVPVPCTHLTLPTTLRVASSLSLPRASISLESPDSISPPAHLSPSSSPRYCGSG